MDKKYDLVFILNAPAFYKMNLLNALSARCNVFAIIIGRTKEVIIPKELSSIMHFDYKFISTEEFDRVKVWYSLFHIFKTLKSLKYDYLISSWDRIDMVLSLFLSSYRKRCFILESSIYESHTDGIKGFLKRRIVSSVFHAFVAGTPHANLLKILNYQGNIHLLGGVGLFPKKIVNNHRTAHTVLNYIYTGRLTDAKNLKLLITAFNQNKRVLTIVGDGKQNEELKTMAKDNITFLGFVENERLGALYASYDCFVLPSTSETWGLVVEEALFHGMPVIVSDKVGSNIDMVEKYDSGVIFNYQSIDSLNEAIERMEDNYSYYLDQVSKIDFAARDIAQIECYCNILKK